MTNKHTQGGWARNIKPASKYNTIYAGRNTHVAQLATSGLSEEEIEANCNLIAAAPDLLSILKEALTYMQKYKKCDNKGFLDDMQKVINKAEGKA